METNPKPQIVSTTGNAIKEEALRKFEASLLGEVIHPSDERYELARRLWNGMLDPRRPGMIVRCAAAVDVARSVEFARTNELAVAVRAGGHVADEVIRIGHCRVSFALHEIASSVAPASDW